MIKIRIKIRLTSISAHVAQEYLLGRWDGVGYMQATIALGDLIGLFVRPYLPRKWYKQREVTVSHVYMPDLCACKSMAEPHMRRSSVRIVLTVSADRVLQ